MVDEDGAEMFLMLVGKLRPVLDVRVGLSHGLATRLSLTLTAS